MPCIYQWVVCHPNSFFPSDIVTLMQPMFPMMPLALKRQGVESHHIVRALL